MYCLQPAGHCVPLLQLDAVRSVSIPDQGENTGSPAEHARQKQLAVTL